MKIGYYIVCNYNLNYFTEEEMKGWNVWHNKLYLWKKFVI